MPYYGPTDLITYRHNYREFGEEVLRARFMEDHLVDRAIHGQSVAEHESPVDTGQFAASWVIESGRRGGKRRDRAFATLTNTDPRAADIEFGHDIYPEGVTYTKSGRRRKPRPGAPVVHVDGAHVLGKATAAMSDD